ncbi:MAG TPA: hypothetical protein VFB27_01120 [Opitutaceae bacterium]|nr:hypothetical protein [Opitutaceae bacterium]
MENQGPENGAARWARASLIIGGIALVAISIIFFCAATGFHKGAITFDRLVYCFLGMGALGISGLGCSIIALLRRERRLLLAVAGFILNAILALVGGSFVILLQK